MSERKSDEIKMRVAPSFKAKVQAAAAKADVSMTEWLEDAAEGKLWAEQNARLDSTTLETNAIAMLDVDESQFRTLLGPVVAAEVETSDIPNRDAEDPDPAACPGCVDVCSTCTPTYFPASEPKSWMFEGRGGG